MAASFQNNLIVVKGEDKTASIQSWEFDRYKPVVFITFNNGKSYPYNINDVQFLKDPKNITVLKKLVYYKGNLKSGAQIVQIFGSYCRIVYRSNYSEICFAKDVKIIDSALNNGKSRNCFEYLKNIAVETGLKVNNHNILAAHYDKINFIRDDSVLASFLSGERNTQSKIEKGTAIYPFGFNLSQKRAVENALNCDISVIEGPPGTGKTQTILNIIANAVMRGESVAVVSNNNSATENVFDKLKKNGVEFIAAPLGCTDNKNVFISGQNTQLPDMSQWVEKPSKLMMSGLIAELDAKLKLKNEYLSIFKFLAPAVGLFYYDDASRINKETQGISTCSFNDIKNFYLDAFEILADCCDIVIGLDNIDKRFNYNAFTNRIDMIKFRNQTKGVRIKNLSLDEFFAARFNLKTDSNELRNAVGHNNFEYNGITQKLSFTTAKGENKSAYLIDVALECVSLSRSAYVLLFYVYELKRYCFLQKGKRLLLNPLFYRLAKPQNHCPCGSGAKYRNCCKNDVEKRKKIKMMRYPKMSS